MGACNAHGAGGFGITQHPLTTNCFAARTMGGKGTTKNCWACKFCTKDDHGHPTFPEMPVAHPGLVACPCGDAYEALKTLVAGRGLSFNKWSKSLDKKVTKVWLHRAAGRAEDAVAAAGVAAKVLEQLQTPA